MAARPDWAEIAGRLAGEDAGGRAPGAGGVATETDATEGVTHDVANDATQDTTRDATQDTTCEVTDGATHGATEGTTPRTVHDAGAAGTAGVTALSPDAAGVAASRAGADAAAPRATPGARTRLVLKVQDGCAGACTYCVVRLVRGEPRSVSLEDALAAARAGIAGGCGEVVLSGIDLGAWRDGGARLPELVEAVAGLDGLRRVRLSSVEPRHVDAALLASLAHPRVARHLHVPLQSADDGVLRDMRRPYTWEGYLRAVGGLRRAAGSAGAPGAAGGRDTTSGGATLSTDVIVGYPTEDEAAFARRRRVGVCSHRPHGHPRRRRHRGRRRGGAACHARRTHAAGAQGTGRLRGGLYVLRGAARARGGAQRVPGGRAGRRPRRHRPRLRRSGPERHRPRGLARRGRAAA